MVCLWSAHQGECGSTSPCVLLSVRRPHPPSEGMLLQEYCGLISLNTPISHSEVSDCVIAPS